MVPSRVIGAFGGSCQRGRHNPDSGGLSAAKVAVVARDAGRGVVAWAWRAD